MWLPSHSNIDGNDKADAAAKRAATSNSLNIKVPQITSCYHKDLQKMLLKCTDLLWDHKWRENNDDSKLKIIRKDIFEKNPVLHFKKKEQVVLTRLRIGHTNMAHLFLMKRETPPECENCEARLTVEHLIVEFLRVSDLSDSI